jgi:ParB family chromosome partitioning protein
VRLPWYFILFSFLRKENYGKFGIEDAQAIPDEGKMEPAASRSAEQENVLRRDFIIYALSQASGDCFKSKLLLEFATIHFPGKVAEIKRQCNEAYKKKHERIAERIRELQPCNGEHTEVSAAGGEKQPTEALPALEAAVTEEEETVLPGTFDAPDADDIPLYPELPEQAEVGDIPDDDGDILEAIHEEFAA